MWDCRWIFSFINFVIFSSSISTSYQSSNTESYIAYDHTQQSIHQNVLWNNEPPTVTKELPLAVSFYSNDILRLHCNVNGNPIPNYQWYVAKGDYAERSTNIHDQNFERIPLATNSVLVIDGKSTPMTYLKYIYYCAAHNSLGTLHTNKIIVEKVNRLTKISIKYVLHAVYAREKFVVQCKLVPELMSPYKFQYWEVQVQPGQTLRLNETVGRYSVIQSTKFPQLHIRNVTDEDFSQIKVRCVFQNTVHNHEDIAPSPFKPIEKFPFDDIPIFTNQRCPGETVTATVGTNIELPWCSVPRTLNVTWYRIDPSNLSNKVEIGTKVNDSKFAMISRRYGNLLIKNVTKDDAGKYMVAAIFWPFHTIFTLIVHETPIIILSPQNIRVKLFASVEFHCSITSSKTQFRWLHNGLRIVHGYDDGNVEVVVNQNTSTLKVKKARLSASGVYQCIATALDEKGAVTDYRQASGTLLLSEVAPRLVKQSPRVEKGSSVAHEQMSTDINFKTIECVFAANPRPNIDWYHDSNRVSINEQMIISIDQDPNSIYNFVAKLTINLKDINNQDDIVKYAGEYQARATNQLGSSSCNTFILMKSNLELRLPSEQTAVGGVDYVMSCYFVANEVPEFFWDRKVDKSDAWETLPVNHRTNLIENGHKLLLKNVIKNEDEGIYRCTVKLNKENRAATTRLHVAYPPILQNLPTKHDSSQVQIHICTIGRSADKPWYAWWTFTKYNNNETVVISPHMKNSIFSVYYNQAPNYSGKLDSSIPAFLFKYPNAGVDLNVKARSNDKDSFGRFVCHVKNHIGSDYKVIEDSFLRLEFKIAPPSSSEVVVGDNLYLDCTAKESDLNPVVKWRLLKEDSKYVDINDFRSEYDGRIYQYNNGTLVMKNIKESDPSKLLCFIFPPGKSDMVQSKISYIEIRVPARIEKLPKEIFKESSSAFNLSCHVYGHAQDMMVSWLFRSSDMVSWASIHKTCIYSNENQCLNQYRSNSGKFSPINEIHNRTYHTVHLEFRDISESISGHYKCEAKNKFNIDADQSATTLTIISKPSMVIIEPVQKESTSTSVGFEWKPPERNGNRPILRYIISYYEISSRTINGKQRNVTHKTIRVNNTIQSIVIDQLRPHKKYAISIAAENEVGVSEATTISLMTQEAKPQKSVNHLIASSTKPDEILISWSDPDPEYQNGFINRYQMCYQRMPTNEDTKSGFVYDKLKWPDSLAEVNQYTNVTCQDTDKRTISVSYLPQFTDFVIRVIAFNSIGASPPQFTKVRTLEDLPQAPPSRVTCEGQHQAIQLTWNPPGRQTINGVLIGYAVYYYEPNQYRDESGMKSVSVQGRTDVVIDQLKPYTSYSIQVMAINRKGLGPPSDGVICTTKEAKPEAPEMLKIVRINNTCLSVSWLHTQHPNGRINAYCLIGMGFHLGNPKCQIPDINKRYNSMTVCDPYKRFSPIQVYARNQYDGAMKEASRIDDINSIISIGGEINVKEGASVVLPCETASSSYTNIYWKKDGREIKNNDYPNIKIFKNFSLDVSSIEKYGRNSYTCSTDVDSIDYHLIVQESTDGIPRTPIIDDSRMTENSVFIRWKSQGSSDVVVPITGFIVSWENLYTGVSKTVSFDEKARSFYLNNVTCASDFLIQVYSQSGNGKSKFSDSKRLKTLGSVPEIADTSVLLPRKNIDAHSANFNLLAFAPGNNCSATYYTIEIDLTSSGNSDFTESFIRHNISVHELENKCCFKVTKLNPMTQYKYRVTAYNPAGSTQSYNTIETPGINGGLTGYNKHDKSTNNFPNQSWLLMIVLVIVIIFVLIVVIVGILYILRSKEKKAQTVVSKAPIVKPDFGQNRYFSQTRNEKPGIHDDTASIDSEPSPYAVYQPDADQKMGQIRSQQFPQQSATPLYNYTDHHYNQIRYDKIPGRPVTLDNRPDNYRRANSAECLSSLGNASVTGVVDLESPSNIDPNIPQDYFRAPFNHCPDNDEVFQNLGYPDFSTVNRKKKRRESETFNRFNSEETGQLMPRNDIHGQMNRSRHYDPSIPQGYYQQHHQPPQPHQLTARRNYPQQGNAIQHNFHQQMSMPEPESMYHSRYGHPSNRLRSTIARNHPSSQTMLPNNPGSSAQISSYGSYYDPRLNQTQLYSTSSGVRGDNEPTINQYSSYIAGSSLSNYNPVSRTTTVARPPMERIESPDEGIYTDRVVVV